MGSACSKEETKLKAQGSIKVISRVRLGKKVQGKEEREQVGPGRSGSKGAALALLGPGWLVGRRGYSSSPSKEPT